MKNAKHVNRRSLLLTALLALAVFPQLAQASWGFTATIYNTCGVSVPTPALPPITGFPDDSYCETTRNQVLAIVVYSTTSHGATCQVGYHCTPCTGSGGDFGSFSGNIGSGISTPVARSPLTGGFAGAVFAPLNGGVTAVNPYGSDAGQPTFSPHYSENSQYWQSEASARHQTYPSLMNQAPSISSLQYESHFSEALASRCGDPGCVSRGTGFGSSIRTMGPQYSQPDAPERTTDDPSFTGAAMPMISIDASKAQSIGGAGITQGAPDKPPPPTPEKADSGGQCRKKWWYNTATRMCYGNIDSCQGDNSAGSHRCYEQ